ncbi:precorrin-6A/cobalt-precorrin-6A reductase [uncultured Roseobacter sp.]|uniref:precorrin-6A/cobalt-precorrin-6A reductase n=1 Tax=uncultured Roseobacter sp. TaxID=114847 RepID=UPI00260B86AB|nr:precorrin-6A/cobalt-precorrin-6A reductase [uncultured Roseobacter sp.]
MRNGTKTLVMAGAREAHSIVSRLVTRGRNVIASLPEPERVFDPLPVPTRIGPFHDANALDQWFEDNQVACVIDASHAFDATISSRTAVLCAKRNLRYVRVLRPSWRPTGQDRWIRYTSVEKAAKEIPANARVFSNTGRASLPEFAEFAGQALFLRQTQNPTAPPPFSFVSYVVGKPPFSQRHEEQLFRDLRISMLICRNVGGAASMSKLLAARRLGVRVSMIDRPDPPVAMPVVETVAEALAWEANP